MDETEPLDDGHHQVYSGAHVVCCESSHEGVKFRRGRADAHEERNLDEDDEERAHKAQSTEEDHYADVEKIREAYCKAEEYADNSGPLSVDTEIPRREFLCERHDYFPAMKLRLCWLMKLYGVLQVDSQILSIVGSSAI